MYRDAEREILATMKRLMPTYLLLSALGTPASLTTSATRGARTVSKPGLEELEADERVLRHFEAPDKSEALATIKPRIGQVLQRKIAESNLPDGCAMCRPRIAERRLLIASHIKRWADCTRKEKYDEGNVLRLCVMHDQLFERGFLRIGDQMEVECSDLLRDEAARDFVGRCTRSTLDGWSRTQPSGIYLSWHRKKHTDMAPYAPVSKLIGSVIPT